MVAVDDFFNNKGDFQGCDSIPYPDMEYTKLCPNYFQNINDALQDPPQVPKCAAVHPNVVANARLPLECEISKEHGGLQFALDFYLKRAVEALGDRRPSAEDLAALEHWIRKCNVDVKRRDNFRSTALHSLAVGGSTPSIALAENWNCA
jgi:hypothetical protein